MDENAIATFKFRKNIVDNLDTLVAYSKKYHKDKNEGQLSLFSSETIEIDRPQFDEKDYSLNDLKEVLDEEIDRVGMALTYDVFNEYALIETVLCTHKLHELDITNEDINNGIMLIEVKNIEYRKTKYGKSYAKLFMSRNGVVKKLYMFSDNFDNDIREVIKGRVHLLKFRFDAANDMFNVKKIQLADKVVVHNYIEKIRVILEDINYITRMRNYLYCCKDENGFELICEINGEEYAMPYTINLSSTDINELRKRECNVEIIKRR